MMNEPRFWPSWRRNLPQATINRRPAWQVVEERKNAVNAPLECGCTIAEVAAITGQTYGVVEQYAKRVNTARLGRAAMLKFERMAPKTA